MKTFEFTITLSGTGETEAEAWQDACDAFAADPGAATGALVEDDDALWWSSGCGRIELRLSPEDVDKGHHSGVCDGDITALRKKPYIAAQLDTLNPATVAEYLADWSTDDHEANLDRLLWLACGDIQDDPSH